MAKLRANYQTFYKTEIRDREWHNKSRTDATPLPATDVWIFMQSLHLIASLKCKTVNLHSLKVSQQPHAGFPCPGARPGTRLLSSWRPSPEPQANRTKWRTRLENFSGNLSLMLALGGVRLRYQTLMSYCGCDAFGEKKQRDVFV